MTVSLLLGSYEISTLAFLLAPHDKHGKVIPNQSFLNCLAERTVLKIIFLVQLFFTRL